MDVSRARRTIHSALFLFVLLPLLPSFTRPPPPRMRCIQSHPKCVRNVMLWPVLVENFKHISAELTAPELIAVSEVKC